MYQRGTAFSSDGKTLASGSFDTTVLLWDVIGHGLTDQGKVTPKELQTLWETLGSNDAAKAHQAMSTLIRVHDQTVAWVREHLPPIPKPSSKEVARLLRDLDDERFAVREEAEVALKRFAELATPALRKALKGKPSAEVRRRVTSLLDDLDRKKTPEQLRSMRAIEVLERIGTQEARKVSEELARGAPEANQTQDAIASLDRLAKRSR